MANTDSDINRADREEIEREVARLQELIERINAQAARLQRVADGLPDHVTDGLDIEGLKDKAETLKEEVKALEG